MPTLQPTNFPPRSPPPPPRLTLVLGTNRPESMTRRVGEAVARIYAEMGDPLQVLDLAHLPARLFRPESYSRPPAPFRPWSEAVVRARGLILVIPGYNGGMPGVLKYFIDLLPFPASLERKPVCFIGLSAGRWGALRPVEQLQQVCLYRNAYLYLERVFLPGCDRLFTGDKFTDTEAFVRLKSQAEGFAKFCHQLEPCDAISRA